MRDKSRRQGELQVCFGPLFFCLGKWTRFVHPARESLLEFAVPHTNINSAHALSSKTSQSRPHLISPRPSSSASTTSIPYRGRWNPSGHFALLERINKEAVVGSPPAIPRSCRAPCRPHWRLCGPAHLSTQAFTTMEVATYTTTRSQSTFQHSYA